jgi:aarF domain-containing kinase
MHPAHNFCRLLVLGSSLVCGAGKICILDFGLMTDVTPEQSIALVEYIAHLSAKDWEAVTRDLVTLGFIPPGG